MCHYGAACQNVYVNTKTPEQMLSYASTREKPIRPTRLKFGLLSADEVRKMAVVRVTETTLYYRQLPNSGGLLDPLMGSVDRRHLCASCMRDARSCQGHVGYIELSFPMYHIGFIETVLKTIRCTCFACCKLCATQDDLNVVKDLSGKNRLLSLHSIIRSRKTCPHCGMQQPTFTRTPLGIKVDWPNDMEWECEEEKQYCTAHFTAREALSILRHITNEDCQALGFDPIRSHPRNMILEVLVVPPPCTRPAIYASEGSRSRGQNDLTVKLLDCLKRSIDVETMMNGVHWRDFQNFTPDFMERLARLQYEVFTLVNNNVRGYKPANQRSSHTQKTLSDRLKGKEGRVRGNLMGKRVDFSARCVITPDPYFSCDRVGVPYSIAKVLTIPETVNSINIQSLTQRVRNGHDHIKGAQTIIHSDGSLTSLEHCTNRSSLSLHIGDIVERNLDDDDTVVFNRQPSLHKHGMQAHRVRLMPGHTFRLSLVVASPYNADFDGDEMNLHVPQGCVSRTECAALLAVPQNVIGPQSNKPVMGIVQDSLLGLHILTLPETFIDHAHTCRILGCMINIEKSLPKPCVTIRGKNGKKAKRLWSGKQIFSLLIPKELYMEPEKLQIKEGEECPVVVRAGQLLCGVLRKMHVGTAAGGLVDIICRDFGGVACCRFFDDAQRLTHAFLLQRMHHVGIHDVMLSAQGQTQVSERLYKATHLCEEIQKEVASDDVPAEVAQTAESTILAILSKTLMQSGSIVNEHMKESNAIRRMVTAGSKGTFINLSQICAALGQQSLEGGRIVAEKGDRTLPCFPNKDISMASRGLVTNSYALGLSPTELFYHAIGGREGLVDTAVKTSRTGYLQRRMNKSFEDHTTHLDGSIRNALNEVISFVWGSDGFHPVKVERVKLACLQDKESTIVARMTPSEADLFFKLRTNILRSKSHILTTEIDVRVLVPFNPQRMRQRIKRAIEKSKFMEDAVISIEEASNIAIDLAKLYSSTTGVAILDVFCSSEVKNMSKTLYKEIIDDVKIKLSSALCPSGESVGCLAAQSTGEPLTQLTLNTFHTAGVASKNVTLGIPRLQELIDASKTPKTPCTVVRFRHPYNTSEEFAKYMANTLPLTRLTDVVVRCDIELDPDVFTTNIDQDRSIVEGDALLNGESLSSESMSRYVVRMILHRNVMRVRKLTPTLLRCILRERLGPRAHVLTSENNSVEWILRIRFNYVKEMCNTGNLVADQEAILCHRAANVLLDTVVIGGNSSIVSADHTSSSLFRISNGVIENVPEYVVHAYGSFLADCAASECIDWYRCTSNDVFEVYNTLGIEACAHVLFDQLKTVLSFDGQYIDDRHLSLIVDSMCRNGRIVPLNRHGINRADTSPLMRASFEETIDVLCDAACYAETENAKGVTTSIMTGQLAEFGTGTTDVLFHEDCLAKDRYEDMKTTTSRKCRVFRSTCRSHIADPEEVYNSSIEYVINDPDQASSVNKSTPAFFDSDSIRPRARFKLVSPNKK